MVIYHYIEIIWRILVTPDFLYTRTTPEDGSFLALARDVCLRILPTTMEVKPEWHTVQYVSAPTITGLDATLAATVP